MECIAIIGCGGAGKSTFAKKLHSKTGLELIHLDKIYWKDNWRETPKEEWQSIVSGLAQKGKWIIDGNYNGTIDIRLNRADTIIFFDVSRWICLRNHLKRIMRSKLFNEIRDDIPETCKEHFDFGFMKWIWNYQKINRDRYLEKLAQLKQNKSIVIFNTYNQANSFLDGIKPKKIA